MVLQHLVVEDGEVKGQTQLDGVAGGKVDLIGLLVRAFRILGDLVERASILAVLSNVAVVVANHLDEEGLGLLGAGVGKHVILDHLNDLLAVLVELGFNLGLVVEERLVELGVLGVLFDCTDRAHGGTLARNEILEGDGEQISLIRVNIALLLGKHLLEEVDHVVVALGLFGNTGEENFFFNVDHLVFSKSSENLNYNGIDTLLWHKVENQHSILASVPLSKQYDTAC